MSQADWPKFMVRLPKDAKRFIAAQAKRNASSQNSEMVRCIRERMDREAASAVAQSVAKRTA